MGLFKRIWNAITNWIADRIREVVEWVVSGLDWLRKQISYWKHRLKQKLAEWLEDDVNFLLFVIAIIAAAIILPHAIQALMAKLNVKSFKDLTEALKETIATFLDEAHIVELSLLHRLLSVFWDEYKDIVNVFNVALASLSEELGYSSGMILSILFATKVVIQRGSAFTGADPLLLEYEWYEQATAFMKKVDAKFLEYTYEPGNFMRDIIDDFIIPYSQRYTENEGIFMDTIRNNYLEAREKIDQLEQFRESIDLWIEALPDEIGEQFDKRWAPISEYLEDRYNLLNEQFLMKWDEAFIAIDEYEERIRIKNERLEEEQRLLEQSLLPETMKIPIVMRELFDDCFIRAGISPLEDSMLYEAFTEIENAGLQIIKDGLEISIPSIPIMELERPTFTPPGMPHKKYDSWNVGEY